MNVQKLPKYYNTETSICFTYGCDGMLEVSNKYSTNIILFIQLMFDPFQYKQKEETMAVKQI